MNAWWQGKLAYEKNGKTDPRLGIAFIELATKKKAKEYYDSASEIYLWSFSKIPSRKYLNMVIDEAKRVLPLVDATDIKEWREEIKQFDPHLSFLIRSFWFEHDFRPTTKSNERLIEHWQRIAYAREHYLKNRISPYRTDDRGTIYVKYGEPDRKQRGNLGSSSMSKIELMRWGYTRTSLLDDPTPQYEVWSYETIGTKEPAVFLFSYREGAGEYGLQPCVEYLVPRRGGIDAAEFRAVCLIIYYAELKEFSEYFYDRYSRYEQIFESRELAGRKSPSLRKAYIDMISQIFYANKNIDRFNPVRKYANPERSEYEEKINPIDIAAFQIRSLSRAGQPKLTVVASTAPQFESKHYTRQDKKEYKAPEYKLLSTFIIRNREMKEIYRKTKLYFGSVVNSSVFQFEHTPDIFHGTFAAEAYRSKADTILANGRKILHISPPLSRAPDSLELSDLILGIEAKKTSEYSFPVYPVRQFWRNNPITIYFEIYHLQQDKKGKAYYSIEIGASGSEKNKKEKENSISLSYELETDKPRRSEQYSIDISKLKEGDYELFVKIKDKLSFQKKTRKVKFEITKD